MLNKLKLIFTGTYQNHHITIDGVTYIKTKKLMTLTIFLRIFTVISIPLFVLITLKLIHHEILTSAYLNAAPVVAILFDLFLIELFVPNQFWHDLKRSE